MVTIDGSSLVQGLNTSGENYKSEILVVTMDDNLTHPYFSSIDLNRDNVTPIGSCVLVAPYEKELGKYWLKYNGTVIVSFKMQGIEQTNTNTEDYFNKVLVPTYNKYQAKLEKKAKELATGDIKTEEKEVKTLKNRLINNFYNYSFIGKVSRIKQKGKKYVIYLDDIGWKFMQKVPKEFRNSFVAGQTLDNAFQAMCEFMGVEFAYSIEDLNEYTFSADGYSVEKDGQVIEDVPQILKEWANGTEEEEEEEDLDSLETNSGLVEYNEKAKKNVKKSIKNLNNAIKVVSPAAVIGEKIANNIEKSTRDLSSSLYNDKKKPDKDDSTLDEEDDKQQTLEEKIAQYQEEFDEKIKNLFIGNSYYPSDLCNPILSYNDITIEPTTPETSTSSMGSVSGANEGEDSNEENGGNNGTITGGSATYSLQARDQKNKNGWYGGQLYENGKIVLYSSYINSLSPAQAKAKYAQKGVYTSSTYNKLQLRALGRKV